MGKLYIYITLVLLGFVCFYQPKQVNSHSSGDDNEYSFVLNHHSLTSNSFLFDLEDDEDESEKKLVELFVELTSKVYFIPQEVNCGQGNLNIDQLILFESDTSPPIV